MKHLKTIALGVTVAALLACSGGGGKAGKGKKDGAAANDDEIICCEFGAATGTSTRALCKEHKGKVVPKSKCP